VFVYRFDWNYALVIAPVVTTISITLSSNKIKNEDILVPANPGPPGKWPLKWTEREYVCYVPLNTLHEHTRAAITRGLLCWLWCYSLPDNSMKVVGVSLHCALYISEMTVTSV